MIPTRNEIAIVVLSYEALKEKGVKSMEHLIGWVGGKDLSKNTLVDMSPFTCCVAAGANRGVYVPPGHAVLYTAAPQQADPDKEDELERKSCVMVFPLMKNDFAKTVPEEVVTDVKEHVLKVKAAHGKTNTWETL